MSDCDRCGGRKYVTEERPCPLCQLAAVSSVDGTLRERLEQMEAQKDGAYYERNQVVAALSKVFPAGVAKTAIEGWSEDWHGCVYIDLPTGQVSWHFHDSQAHLFAHLPPYRGEWDGHDTPEKYHRLALLAPEPREPKGQVAVTTDLLRAWAAQRRAEADTLDQFASIGAPQQPAPSEEVGK